MSEDCVMGVREGTQVVHGAKLEPRFRCFGSCDLKQILGNIDARHPKAVIGQVSRLNTAATPCIKDVHSSCETPNKLIRSLLHQSSSLWS